MHVGPPTVGGYVGGSTTNHDFEKFWPTWVLLPPTQPPTHDQMFSKPQKPPTHNEISVKTDIFTIFFSKVSDYFIDQIKISSSLYRPGSIVNNNFSLYFKTFFTLLLKKCRFFSKISQKSCKKFTKIPFLVPPTKTHKNPPKTTKTHPHG